jgi:hypothetical protein
VFAQARILSARIAELWEFPESVTRAIGQADAHADADPQAQALAQGERLSKLRILVDTGRFPADDPFVTAGLGRGDLQVSTNWPTTGIDGRRPVRPRAGRPLSARNTGRAGAQVDVGGGLRQRHLAALHQVDVIGHADGARRVLLH